MWARQLLLKAVLINWDLKAGTIICDFDELVNKVFSLPMANRSILKISAKIFDPPGLTSPENVQINLIGMILY